MPKAARLGDMHTCPLAEGTKPHLGGPIAQGELTVLIEYKPAARVGDQCVCAGPPDSIAKGSGTVIIGYMPAARLGDLTAHGGMIKGACRTVIIGG